MNSQHFDIAVIGGAASGASFALRMARAGWKVAIVEKSAFPRRKVCGEFLSATNQPLFKDLGLHEAINDSAGPPVTDVAVFFRENVISSQMPQINGEPLMKGNALGRDQLDNLLMNRAIEYGTTAFQPARVTGVNVEPGCSTISIKDDSGKESLITAPIVVGAHGSWGASNLPSFPQSKKNLPSDLFGFKAYFKDANLKPGLMPLFVFTGGYGGLVETNDNRLSFSCCVRRDELSKIRKKFAKESPGQAVVNHVCEIIRGNREAHGGAIVDGKILSTGPIRPGIRKAYTNGIFRVGNAAGEAHPVIAEGVTLAMQSSWLLSEEWIAAGKDASQQEVAHSYQKKWLKCFGTRVRSSFIFAHLAMNPTTGSVMNLALQACPRLLSYGAALSGKSKVVIR
ncbi:MAG: NAD(P)/FAD-dependent oxidoreductase [Verrucomicrobiales bacterium]|nr:NAD(P)/FAD-dependent oxidoreductase [Verrucomicrobiales bacterium]